MYTSRTIFAATLVVLIGSTADAADTLGGNDVPNLGQPIAPQDFQAWNISVFPDGTGLPDGSGTAVQGKAVYAEKCAVCHGDKGEGGLGPRLVGGQGSLPAPGRGIKTVGSFWPYATTLFDYVRRDMPWDHPKTLSNDEVYAVCAYVLSMNGIVGENDVLNKTSLPTVKMPNRDGFIDRYPNAPDSY
jgi:S-disulfanyl-L-cysteine oxidoreductase SoxD